MVATKKWPYNSKLSDDLINTRSKNLKRYFENLDLFLSKLKIYSEYFIIFVDNEYYTLYTYFNNCKNSDDLQETLAIGSRAFFDDTGTAGEANPLFRDYLNCAALIAIEDKVQGALILYIRVNNDVEAKEDLLDEKVSLLGGLLQAIKLAVFELNTISNKQVASNRKTGFVGRYHFTDIIFRSDKFRNLINKVKLISNSDLSVLLQGESGTGKELFASAIHNESARNTGPFVSLNCATLTHDLIESELFGYSDGAFTGALKGGKKGKLELADKGTLFLDEIAELPLTTQAMLLRVLEENELIRLGDEEVTFIDVRIICASNKNLKELCEMGLFRWDLYYRLGGMTLEIPPLRQRKEDINMFADYFVNKLNLKRGISKKLNLEATLLLKKI